MKASEIILNSGIIEGNTRGEAMEMLESLVFEHYESDLPISNGYSIDAILTLFDHLINDNHDAEMGLIASIDQVLTEDE